MADFKFKYRIIETSSVAQHALENLHRRDIDNLKLIQKCAW